MIRISTIMTTAVLLAGAALAHTGVQNAAVKARMDAMSDIAADMKTLGRMSKGALAFDGEKARSAAASIALRAAQLPSLFEAPEDDPKSEAKAAIWSNFADFTEQSEALEALALQLSTSITTRNDLASAMKSLGGTCQTCHQSYRE